MPSSACLNPGEILSHGPHDGHRQRLKPNFWPGRTSSRTTVAGAAVLLRQSPQRHQSPPIDCFGSLAGVLDALPEELCKVKGMGKHGAEKTVKELSGRYLTARTRVDDIARNSRDYYQLLRPYFFGARNELLCLLCMDGTRCAGHPTAARVTSTPWLLPPVSSPRPLLALNAAVVLAHNHVSGIAFPRG